MNKSGIGTVVLAALIAIGLFFLAVYVFMLLVNVVLNQYNIEPLTLQSSMALVALLGIFGGFVRSSK